jgi:hypothetical protein
MTMSYDIPQRLFLDTNIYIIGVANQNSYERKILESKSVNGRYSGRINPKTISSFPYYPIQCRFYHQNSQMKHHCMNPTCFIPICSKYICYTISLGAIHKYFIISYNQYLIH